MPDGRAASGRVSGRSRYTLSCDSSELPGCRRSNERCRASAQQEQQPVEPAQLIISLSAIVQVSDQSLADLVVIVSALWSVGRDPTMDGQ